MSVDILIEMLKTMNVKRSECRDLTFGDAEVFFDTPDGTEIGGGYFGRGAASVWFSFNGMTASYNDDEARTIRSAIGTKAISRNDNEGKW